MVEIRGSEVRRPIEQGDWNMAFMFPDEVAAARERNGLVMLPLAPLNMAISSEQNLYQDGLQVSSLLNHTQYIANILRAQDSVK